MPEQGANGRFLKGNSGGPGRKPGSKVLTVELRNALVSPRMVDDGKTTTDALSIMAELIRIALHGAKESDQLRAIEIILDRIEGRVLVQSIETEEHSEPIHLFSLAEHRAKHGDPQSD